MEAMKRTVTCGGLRKNDEGKTVVLNGWIHRKRDHGGISFINLRDRYGITQVVVDSDSPAELSALATDLKMEYCENAAKVLGIPLMEYVYMPHLTMDKKHVVVSKEKCLVSYINVKRTQQLLHKKNGISIANEKRSATTGQVVNKDKNARNSDIEASMLVSLGADKILQELHGPRADDPIMKQQMNQSIATKGYVMLEELENLPTNKVTLNTVNTYLLSMGLISDLVTPTYILPKTSEELFT